MPNRMAITIEQFTAPGKFEIDESFEEVERILQTPLIQEIRYEHQHIPASQEIKYKSQSFPAFQEIKNIPQDS